MAEFLFQFRRCNYTVFYNLFNKIWWREKINILAKYSDHALVRSRYPLRRKSIFLSLKHQFLDYIVAIDPSLSDLRQNNKIILVYVVPLTPSSR